jgi:CRP-like cAMP-binding protein
MSVSLIDRFREIHPSARRFGAGEFLFHQDDPVQVLYIIERGDVHLVRHQVGGSPLILQRAGPGSLLAEASLFSDRYHCDAVAVRPARTLSLARSGIRDALARDQGLAEAWSAYLAREVQATRLRAEILAMRTVAERLDAWIASNDARSPMRGEWKTIAAEIGVSPEALYREFAKRRKAGR